MHLTSSAFRDHDRIPRRYTCDGDDINPPLHLFGVPKNARSLTLIVDDPDVPPSVREDCNWDHWIVWNIPPETERIEEGRLPRGVVGRNSWGRNAYGGPAPPDREHRYFFKLYALDKTLDLPTTSGKKEVERAMQGHILKQAQLVGRYERLAVLTP
jgi:Raf kinase inhibitor-like YbhB/YbcL family protein